MSNVSLHNKTVRPGSLKGYSYYYSGRKPVVQAAAKTSKAARRFKFRGLIVVAVLAALIGLPLLRSDSGSVTKQQPKSTKPTSAAPLATPAAAPAEKVAEVNHCKDNQLDKFVLVSISERHLWACEHRKTVRDAPVITGLETLPSNKTPRGTFKVYGKIADTALRGSDERGAWDYPVAYWMPYLDNEYGTYGFHDATWRPETSFGQVDPAGNEASRGCVELPLSDMKWLYAWGPTGLTATIVD
jgi:hypothetical protein